MSKTLVAAVLGVALIAAACSSDKKSESTTPATTGAPSTGAPTTADTGASTTASGGASTTVAGSTATTSGSTMDPTKVKTGPGVTDTEIHVAVLNGFTGPVANLAIPAADGMDAYFKMVNDKGGVCGRKLVLERHDTKYDPQLAIQEYRAIHDKVAMMAIVGSAAIFGLSADIKRDNMATLANTGSESVIALDNVLLFITPFSLEVVNGISWAAENQAGPDGNLKLGVVYQADAFGQAGFKAAQYVAAHNPKVKIVGSTTYTPADQNLTAQAQAMKDSGADVVWLHVISSQVGKLLGAADQIGYHPLWLGMSASFASSMVKPLGKLLDNYRFTTSMVSYGEDVPGMKDLETNYKAIAPNEPGQDYVVTGWVNGATSAQLLQRACDLGDLSLKGISSAEDGLKVVNNGVASADYTYGATPDQRIPSRLVRIDKVNETTTFGEPVTPFFESPLAKSWTLADGA
ncbi:MAG: ABC transporter substrate-binding protein [Ilumatobacteraceae bacterium]